MYTANLSMSTLEQRFPPNPAMAWLLVLLLVLVSTQIALRGLVMFDFASSKAPSIAQPQPVHPANHPSTTPSERSHHHAEHCPLCFMYWLTGDFVGDFGSVYSPLLLKKLRLEATLARDEFLQNIAARAPPRG